MGNFYPLIVDYKPTLAFWHEQQRNCFDQSAEKELFFIAHEPRVGKSKIIVDTCAHNRWGRGFNISGALIVAWPNGAELGWLMDAFPESYPSPWAGINWNASESKSKGWRQRFDDLLKFTGFAVMVVGADSLDSKRCREDIGIFLSKRKRVMVVGDESDFMVNEEAQRSRTMHSIAHGRASQFVAMRRILTGTPCDSAGPLDFYSQVGFLSFDILGYKNPVEYARHYAELKTGGRSTFWQRVKANGGDVERAKGWSAGGKLPRGRDWWTTVDESEGVPKFKNMDEFWKRLGPYISRATYAECFPNAKRPEFRKLEYDLTPKQREVYDNLCKHARAEIAEDDEVKVEHHLTKLLRLQQVACNYWPERSGFSLHETCKGMGCEDCDDSGVVDDGRPPVTIDEWDQRLDVTLGRLGGQPAIVWSRFRHRIDVIVEACKVNGLRVCQYDGRVNSADKLANRQGFQAGKFDVIVCNQSAASRGLPLHAAKLHVFDSNVFSYRTRKQAEERAEHGSKTEATVIYDVVGRGTVDDLALLPALRTGMNVASYVLRDERREWL